MKTAELIPAVPRPADAFPASGKRLLIYVVYDRRGDVEDYIPYALSKLRAHCDRIFVVVNGALTDQGRAVLEPVADDILVRPNRGFDIWGYKDGLDAVGAGIEEYDEVVLANDTWFGPVRPFEPVFERMDAQKLHFWGMTDHVRVDPNPFTGTGYLAYHIQSYWLAVRRDLVASEEWTSYWRDLPPMDSYSDAVVKHEATFTEFLTGHGFVGEVAFPTITDRIENHAVLYAEQLIEQGCPTLKRRPFFQWPPYLDHLAVIGRWTLDCVARYGYPMRLIYTDLARNVEPHTLNADAALLDVVADEGGAYDEAHPLRTVVIAHIFYEEMASEMLERIDYLPGAFDLVVTTTDEQKAERIRRVIAERHARGASEVRVVDSNNGRDQSAFLIACRDVLVGGEYDVVVKLHSKRTVQDAYNAGMHFQRHQFENLLSSPGYASNVLSMFQRQPELGLVYPPMVHIGYGTLGHAWWDNRPAFIQIAAQLGIRVPIDETSPLAPFGSMYIARPEALAHLVAPEWTYDDFGDASAYRDGGLAHVLERVPSYAAGEAGFVTRTIATADYAAVSYTTLDYHLDQMSSTLPDSTMHQIQFLRRLGPLGRGTIEDFSYILARLRKPEWEPRLQRLFGRARTLRHRLRRRG
ncbi:rhamnan synthesis F family protein [Microbacterium binotii]|uniref:rhamnan synthesis F family protein n=1 Tax=Microbacterium binotii TaxID=462710 RepID=UPI001F174720|nr:rhamnan synthesis F family protein [Microbacterium binotii]UIN29875.1 rhamnan synthesis F family protein [Microbacterium binotii]